MKGYNKYIKGVQMDFYQKLFMRNVMIRGQLLQSFQLIIEFLVDTLIFSGQAMANGNKAKEKVLYIQ